MSRPAQRCGNDASVAAGSWLPSGSSFAPLRMVLVLAVYLALIVLASLGGGWLTARMRLTHTRMQLIMSFVAGLMLRRATSRTPLS